MKRIYQIAVVAVMALSVPVAISSPVAAKYVCDVGFSAPDSNNMCRSLEEYTCSVTNRNEVTIQNSDQQTVASGEVDVDSNTSGGSATSGLASNDNSTTFTVVINNGSLSDEGNGVCTAAIVVPAKEVPEEPEKPAAPTSPERPVGGMGGGAAAPVQPARSAAPVALPVTSGDAAPKVALLTAGGAAIIASVAMAYRRFDI